MGRKKSTNWKETRRLKAIELLESGWTQQQVATAYGVSQPTVCGWKRKYDESGKTGLLLKGHKGRVPRLNTEDERKLSVMIERGAVAYGFEGDFWTHARVSVLIRDKFKVDLRPRSCGDLLKKLGFVYKSPGLRSYQQDPEKVREWKEETLPSIKKSP